MENQNKAFGIASMVCGIISLLCCCCSEWLSIGLAIAAIVLFVLERSVAKSRTGFATAGLICGIIAIVISLLGLILAGVLASSGIMEMYESLLSEYGFDMSQF